MKTVRLAIVGGRDFQDYEFMKTKLAELGKKLQIVLVVSGGARGADTLGERWADENGIPKNIFPALWDKYGKSAGFRRNRDIVAGSDAVAAFWDGKSRGTENTIAIARAAGKPVYIFRY